MAKICADVCGNPGVIIDDQPRTCRSRDREKGLRQLSHFGFCRPFGAQLNQIGPTLTKLDGQKLRRPAAQVGHVHKTI
jgi:hypothetical protein